MGLAPDENEIDPDDPATKFMKMQKRLKKAVVDEYTKEGVQHHKEMEQLEIEERFHNSESKEMIKDIVAFDKDLKGM